MDKVAYENLKLLNEKYNDSFILINDNNILSLIEKDSFDTCSKLDTLEYPIFFTYHHILNIVDYDKDISYKKKINLIDMIESSLNNLIDFLKDYEGYDKINKTLSIMIDDIYERTGLVKKHIKYNYFENIIFIFDEFVEACRYASKYLYFSPRPYDILYDMKPGELYEPNDELCFGDDSGDDSCNDSVNDSDNELTEDKLTEDKLTEDELTDNELTGDDSVKKEDELKEDELKEDNSDKTEKVD